MRALTGAENSSKHPTLGITDRNSGGEVFLQNCDAANPSCWGFTHGVVITPVPYQHTLIIQRIDLKEKGSQS